MATSRRAKPVRTAAPDVLTRRLTWMLLFRSVVVTALLLFVLGLRFGAGEPLFGERSIVIYSACIASYLSVIAGAIGLKWSSPRRFATLGFAQFFWDSGFATILTLSSEGIESAFAFLFFVNVLSAAAVMGKRAAVLVATVDVVLYTVVLATQLTGFFASASSWVGPSRDLVEFNDVATPYLTHVLGIVLVAILAGYLTEQLQETRASLQQVRVDLSQLEELHAAVLTSLPSGVLTIDGQGMIVYINRAGAEILGIPDRSAVGQPVSVVVPTLPFDQERPSPRRFEISHHTQADRTRILGGIVAMLTGLEQVGGRVVVFQDLTELRRLQQDLARADRLALLGRFSAGLAHEIRNPLAAMIGCLQLLEADAKTRGDEANDESRMLGIVHREAERLASLVASFLMYARPSTPSYEPVDLARLLRSALDTAGAGQPHISFELRGPPQLVVPCDQEQIRQVVWNLLGNAQQAVDLTTQNQRGHADTLSIPPTVRLTLSEQQDDVILWVDDTGPGVPEHLRLRIFEPLFTTRAAGTGLGLATSFQVVSAHGGALHVDESELGGARFEMRIPKHPSVNTLLPRDEEESVPYLQG